MVDATLVAGSGGPGQGEWERLAAGVLKGASVEKLVRSTRGRHPGPASLYPRECGRADGDRRPAGRGAVRPWCRRRDTRLGRPGASGPSRPATGQCAHAGGPCRAEPPPWTWPCGTARPSVERWSWTCPTWSRRWPAFIWTWRPWRSRRVGPFAEAAALTLALAEARAHDRSSVPLALNADPIGAALRAGGPEPEAGLAIAADLARLVLAEWPEATALLADGRLWHAAGASPAQELAAVLGTALAYLRAAGGGGAAARRRRPGRSPSRSPSMPTSSRASPSCVPCGGSGVACFRRWVRSLPCGGCGSMRRRPPACTRAATRG